MKSHFLNLIEKVRTSLWFVPGGLVGFGILLAITCLLIDQTWQSSLRDILPRHGPGTAKAAEVFLSTIGAGLLGITGVSFSITIVTLTLASSQFGPRLIRNFMRSTQTQLVLGGLLGSVVFILTVLGNLPSGPLAGGPPRLSLLVSMGLALFSMALFVFFLHHIAISIQADRVVAGVFGEIREILKRLFPESTAQSDRYESGERVPFPERPGVTLKAERDGYLQGIEVALLCTRATADNLVVHVQPTPGSFVLEGSILAGITGPGTAEFSSEARDEIASAFIIGRQRTPAQDFEFSIRQLVEIGLRALSPGINDPFTAINCIDYLAATVTHIARCGLPHALRHDDAGNLRVSLNTTSYEGVIASSFSQLREQAADRNDVSLHLVTTLADIAALIARRDYRGPVLSEARLTLDNLRQNPQASHLKATLERHQARLKALEEGTPPDA